jgi:hypothetical protein
MGDRLHLQAGSSTPGNRSHPGGRSSKVIRSNTLWLPSHKHNFGHLRNVTDVVFTLSHRYYYRGIENAILLWLDTSTERLKLVYLAYFLNYFKKNIEPILFYNFYIWSRYLK